MLSQQEINQTIYFLNKASILGSESTAHALLLQKLQSFLKETQSGTPEDAKKAEDKEKK